MQRIVKAQRDFFTAVPPKLFFLQVFVKVLLWFEWVLEYRSFTICNADFAFQGKNQCRCANAYCVFRTSVLPRVAVETATVGAADVGVIPILSDID
jgi:hypothetical protein